MFTDIIITIFLDKNNLKISFCTLFLTTIFAKIVVFSALCNTVISLQVKKCSKKKGTNCGGGIYLAQTRLKLSKETTKGKNIKENFLEQFVFFFLGFERKN